MRRGAALLLLAAAGAAAKSCREGQSPVTTNCTCKHPLAYTPQPPEPGCAYPCPDFGPGPANAPILQNVGQHMEVALESTCTGELLWCGYSAEGKGDLKTQFTFIPDALGSLFEGAAPADELRAWKDAFAKGLAEQWDQGYGKDYDPDYPCPKDFASQPGKYAGQVRQAWADHFRGYNTTAEAVWKSESNSSPKYGGIVLAVCDKIGDDDGSHMDTLLRWLPGNPTMYFCERLKRKCVERVDGKPTLEKCQAEIGCR